MDDFTLFLLGCLITITVVSAVEYYRQLLRARKEYEKAKGAVEDIVLSFSRQFKRDGEKLETLAYKVEAASSKSDNALSMAGVVGKKVNDLEVRVGLDSEGKEKLTIRLDDVEKRTRDIVTSQEDVAAKIAALEQQAKQFSVAPEVGFEAVIPIRREKAMAQLTDTEVSVLEMLVSEGPKTAPEIKERVKLSREHTARLMKNLYEEGYLERDSNKIPFKYSLKKEMEKLLRKPETQAP